MSQAWLIPVIIPFLLIGWGSFLPIFVFSFLSAPLKWRIWLATYSTRDSLVLFRHKAKLFPTIRERKAHLFVSFRHLFFFSLERLKWDTLGVPFTREERRELIIKGEFIFVRDFFQSVSKFIVLCLFGKKTQNNAFWYNWHDSNSIGVHVSIRSSNHVQVMCSWSDSIFLYHIFHFVQVWLWWDVSSRKSSKRWEENCASSEESKAIHSLCKLKNVLIW